MESLAPNDRPVADALSWRATRDGDRLRFSAKPKRDGSRALLAVALAWDALLVAWYLGTLATMHAHGHALGLTVLVFPLFHLAIGGALTWAALRAVFGRVEITLDRERLIVAEQPFRARRRLVAALTDVESFALSPPRTDGSQAPHRRVSVQLRDGALRAIDLLLRDDEQARFVCAQLQRALVELRQPRTYRG